MRRAIALAFLLLPSCKRPPEPILQSADDLWSGRAVWRFELSLEPEAMDALAKDRRSFVRGAFRHGGTALAEVGVRFKGHRAMQGWKGKPAFKVKFDEFSKEQRFLGLRSLTLNNLVEDPTMLREALAYRVYREAGAPAPRTGYAELSVNGKPFGLYLVVESVDESFLKARFGSKQGHVYEGEYGCDLHPEDVPGFDVDEGDEAERSDLDALAAAALKDPARLWRDLVDEKAVLGFLAAAAWVGDFDGYRHSHNYRIFVPPGGKAVLIPWGLDRTFKKRLPIDDSDGVLARLCFRDAACKTKYVAALQALTDRLEKAQLAHEADALGTLIAAAAKRDPKKRHRDDDAVRAREALYAFLAERPAEVRAQTSCLAGEKEVDADGDGATCLDCAATDPAVHPGAAEACNGVDDDCSGVVDDSPSCPCPSQVVEGTEFFLCDRAMSWPDAARFCEAQGHVLARIDSKKQSKALYKAAHKLKKDRWWIGLSDRDTEGRFAWADGSPLGFARWAKGQPDNDGCHEDCVALKDGTKGKWHDTHCAQRRPFICAVRTPPPATQSQEADEPNESTELEEEAPPTDTGGED